ncbi:Protein of unknown function [Reichenbachiella faecimaris]|uniref:DUF2490 domain-containing protein n=1 Tax=Reichenbachiella faecimaris TaxID=692418 RepID=A0A1W2G5J5_REIFA|nr:DUF2490 domain-containing protein [Reichenbachiella faecimaris]SMD31949.1 Protein of unknown function [Reichenbachiella faecimaris]
MKQIIGGIILLFSVVDVCGQEVEGELGGWFLILNHYSINEKWRVGNELHVRRNYGIKEQEQFLIRPYIDYKLNENAILTAGYTYLKTSQVAQTQLPIAVPENNVWEQLTLNQTYGKLMISHRYRMEHRFIGMPEEDAQGDYVIDGHKFANRFRYRLTVKRDLGDIWFAHLFNEVWIHQDGLKPSSFDRNWLYAGVGYRVAKTGNVQLGYMHQWVKSGSENYMKRPTLQLTLQYDF